MGWEDVMMVDTMVIDAQRRLERLRSECPPQPTNL